VRSTPSVSALEKRIHDLESSDALLRGQIGDLQTERLKSEELSAKYKRHWDKLKKEKEAWQAEKGDLQCQLEEAYSKVEAEAAAGVERAAKVEHQGYQLGYEEHT